MLSKWCSSHIKSRKNGKKFANNKKKTGAKRGRNDRGEQRH